MGSTMAGAAATEVHALGVPRRTLILAAVAMTGLFALTAFVTGWYKRERLARATRFYERGVELARRGQLDQGIEQYRNALAISRDNPEYQLAVALALMQMKKWNEASVYLHELLEEDPSDAIPNLMLARIAASEDETEQAINYYYRAIYGRWPNDPLGRRVEARLELVKMLARAGSKNRVVAELLQLAEQNPKRTVQLEAAGMLLNSGSPEQALEVYRDLLKTGDRDPEVYEGIGAASLALGDLRQAHTALARAVRGNPRDEVAQHQLALVNESMALDPTQPGLTTEERYVKSRALLGGTVAAAQACLAARESADDGTRILMESARQVLRARPPRDRGEYADSALVLASHLWTVRERLCGTAAPAAESLTVVMTRISR